MISGLKETFTKSYIVERANKAGVRPEEESEKAESCRDNLWNDIQLKGPQRQKQEQNKSKKKKSGRARLVSVQNVNRNILTT